MSTKYYRRLLLGGEFDGVIEHVPLVKLTPKLVNKVTAPISGRRAQVNAPYVIREPQHKPQADSTVIYEYSPGAQCPEIKIATINIPDTPGGHPCSGYKRHKSWNSK